MKRKLLLNPAPANIEGGGNPPQPSPSPSPEPEKGEDDKVEGAPADDPESVSDVLLNAIISDLKGNKEVPKVEPAPEVDATPAPEPPTPATPAPTPAPAAPDKKKKIVLVEPAPEPPSAPVVVPTPIAPTQAPPPSPSDPDAEYVNSLTDEQKDELAEAEVAERLYPEKYKGTKKKLIEYYRRFDKEAVTVEVDSQEYNRLIEAKPKLSTADFKKVQREIGKEEATAAVRAQISPELEELKMGQAEIKARPKVIARLNKFESDLNTMFSNDENSPMKDVSKLLAEKGADAAIAEYPLEAAVASQEIGKSRAMLAEYTLFQNGAIKFQPDNPVHMELYNFVETQGNALQEAGGLVRGGKSFLTRTQYAEHVKAHGKDSTAAKYFTFTDGDIEQLLIEDAKIRIEKTLKKKLDEAKRFGFERKPKATSATPPIQPAPTPATTPPKATPSRPKGNVSEPPPSSDINVVSILGLK